MTVEILIIILLFISILSVVGVLMLLYQERKQIKEVAEALLDVKNGNGNRRVLAERNQLLSPVVYEMNDIIRSYEDKLAFIQQKEEANKQLMTSLSHDIRTPLTTLNGYLDAVYNEMVTGEEREEYIKIARKKAYDLKEYIDVLFDWFKINSNEFSITLQPVEISELTRNILIDWIPIFEEKKIVYSVEIPNSPLLVNLDVDGYLRILNNLIQNIMMHSQANVVGFILKQEGTKVELIISDNGIGIDKEDLKRIFHRLYKCDKGRSQKGSGLGLSIVEYLIAKMGGAIDVESEINKGTSFCLQFPLSK